MAPRNTTNRTHREAARRRLGNTVRSPEIDIDRITEVLDHFGSFQQWLGLIGSELHNQRPITPIGAIGGRIEIDHFRTVRSVGCESIRVEHRRVANSCAVLTCHHSKSEIALANLLNADGVQKQNARCSVSNDVLFGALTRRRMCVADEPSVQPRM